jgi:hypothetical protein
MYPTICVSAIGLREIGFAALFESVIAETDKLENGCPRLSLVGGTNIPERNQFGMGIARQSDAAAGNELSLDTKKNIGDCFLHLADLPTFALDRLSRYEHLLWRQARQIVVTLKSLQHYRRPPRPSPFHSRPAAAIPMNSSDGSRESILQNPKRPVILTEGG